jgi:uncharacterized membrane protein
MSDQGWNNPGQSSDPNAGAGWGQQPPQQPPPQQPPQEGWGQQPPPPQGGPPPQGDQQWGQQPPAPQGGQQWGQQPPAPQGGQQWGQQPGAGGTGSGIDPKIAGILAYVPFGWLGGLIIYLVNKDPLSRFQGAQSILLGIAGFAFFVAVSIIQFVLPSGIAFLFGLLSLLVWFGYFGLSIFLAIQGYALKKTTLPVIGPMAEQWATK